MPPPAGAPGPYGTTGLYGAPMPPIPGRPHPLPWIALALGVASPVVTLLSSAAGLIGLSAALGVVDASSVVAWVLGIAAVVVGIVALAQRRRPATPAILGIALPVVGHVVLLGLWVLVFVGVMTAAGLA